MLSFCFKIKWSVFTLLGPPGKRGKRGRKGEAGDAGPPVSITRRMLKTNLNYAHFIPSLNY